MSQGEINAPSGVSNASNSSIMYEFNLQSGALTWSQALYNELGYPSTEPFSRLEWWVSHIHPDDAMLLNQAMDKLLEPSIPGWVVDYRFRKANGEYIQVRDRASIVRDEQGQATRLIGTVQPLKPNVA